MYLRGGTTLTLTHDERARFEELVARELKPYSLVAREGRFTLDEVQQDILPAARVYRVCFATRPLRKVLFVAADAHAWRLLTGRIDAFNALAAGASVAAASCERARHVARLADAWTTTWELGQLEIASFDEIPWRSWLEARDRETIEATRARVGARIGPERVAQANEEWVFTTWVIAHAKLLHRTLAVSSTGVFARTDEIVAEPLPIPMGRYWTLVDGRLIPTG